MECGRVEQHFGNLEAADGSLAVQANVRGPLHIHRELSKQCSAILSSRCPLPNLANFCQIHAPVHRSFSIVSQKPRSTPQASSIPLPASRTQDEMC
jgi:hypothetical protein